jgi:hypothetical protein
MRKTIGVLTAGLLVLAAALAGTAAVNDYAWFVIDDDFPSAALLSDTRGEYEDYRLPEGDKCVNAWAASTGLFFAYLYRGSNLGDACYTVYPGGVRTYTLQFPEGSAPCTEFGVCTLEVESPGQSPRIRAEKLFGKSAQSTPVAFLFNRGASYEVRADENVYFVVDGPTRTLSYSGTARLWKLGKKGAAPVGSSFIFPFSLTVTRVAP